MVIKRTLLSGVAALGMLSSITVNAQSTAEADLDVQAHAEQLLKSSFSNFEFYSVSPSIVKGIYEIDTGSNIVYYSADANVLIFGEMYNERGENLSEAAIALNAAERLKNLDLSVALEFGPADAPVLTEYSNPLCGWCQRLHGWFDGEGRGLNVRRQIIFAVGHSSKSQELAEHILCSDDPEQAFADVYGRRTPRRLLRCDEGRDLVEQHIQITQAAGVSSTPTLFADGERIRGFDAAKIRDYLVAANNQETPQGEDE